MKNIKAIVILSFVVISACNNPELNTISDSDKDPGTKIYNLEFVANDSEYKMVDSKATFLIRNHILSKKRIFSADSISEALRYYKSNGGSTSGIAEVFTISVKKNDGSYDDVWIWKNPITLTKNGYGKEEFVLYLDSSNALYNGKSQSRLNINFKTKDYDNGYRLYTLNYIYRNFNWELISRERVNTIPDEITLEETAYCIDTINNNCKITGQKFLLNHDYIFRLNNRVCY